MEDVKREVALEGGSVGRGGVTSLSEMRTSAHPTEDKLLASLTVSSAVRRMLQPVADKLLASLQGSAIFCVASPEAGEGRTLVASTLSLMLSEKTDKKVLLIDACLDKPSINRLFHLADSPGLAGCLRNECKLQEAARPVDRLHALPSGRDTQPGRLLRTDAARKLLDAVRKTYDVAIIDLPPLASSEEAAALCDWSDGTVMVVRANATRASAVTKAVGMIDSGKLLGVVLNEEQRELPRWLRRWF